jgi:hypothetical protein
MPFDFTGNESAADIAKAALDSFKNPKAKIVYKKKVPYLSVDLEDVLESKYRVDKLLIQVFGECERICDSYVNQKVLNSADRNVYLRYLAYVCMSQLLDSLPLLQIGLLRESAHDAAFLAPATLIHTIARLRERPDNVRALKKGIRETVSLNLERRLKVAAKDKREYLTGFLNRLPLMDIPTSPGRPLGSTKPEETKAREKAEFESKLEQTVKALYHALGREPFKYEVADALGIGGHTAKGTDSRTNALSNKLRAQKINYAAIVQRVKDLHQ